MRVRFRNLPLETVSSNEASYVSPQQTFLLPAKDYEVHAISVYNGIAFLQVVDEKETPVFLPRVLFDVIEAGVPRDWICNTFPTGSVQLVLGPRFVAETLEAYEGMIDQKEAQVYEFWKRLESISHI